MGVRRDRGISLTVACAIIAAQLKSLDDYQGAIARVRQRVLEAARRQTRLDTDAVVNAADDVERGQQYLTVTGTSGSGPLTARGSRRPRTSPGPS
jgi:S-adenosylmethionine synthetase